MRSPDRSDSITRLPLLDSVGCAAVARLNTWPTDWNHWSAERPPVPELIACTLPLHCIQYTEGVLMLHSGHLLHQIAPATNMQPSDRLITRQGHAVPRDGVYQVYW